MMRNNTFEMLKKILIYILLIILAIIMGLPFLWMFSTALKDPSQTFVIPPQWIPNPIKFQNFIDAWQEANFGTYFVNSAIVTIATVFGQLLTSAFAAFSFARLKYKGRDVLFFGYLATMMIPGQVTMIPNFILMRYFNWIDSYKALIIPAIFTAYGTFMLRQFMLTIPRELDEAAIIDGASKWQLFWRVIFPISKPALATLSVFSFIGAWNSFLWPLIVISDETKFTLPIGLSIFKGNMVSNYNLMMAGTVISVIPILIMYCTMQKYFMKGIAVGAVKG